MAGTHGGARPGAGAPKGGVSHSRRLILGALQKGFTLAGRQAGIPGQDAEEVAMNTAAVVICDMVRRGDGHLAIGLWSQNIKANDGKEGSGDQPKDPLMDGLKRAAAHLNGTPAAHLPAPDTGNGTTTPIEEPGTSPHDATVPPVEDLSGFTFENQPGLFPGSLDDAAGALFEAEPPARDRATPPGGTPPIPYGVESETLEKNFEKKSQGGGE